jgi:diguanylate cyclase (GGDEF)-like protein
MCGEYSLRIFAKLWIGTAVCLTLAQVVASVLLPRGLSLTAVSDILSASLMLALSLAFAQNAIPIRGRLQAFWVMQAAGWAISLANQCWWMFYDLVLQKQLPKLFAGDVLLILPGALTLAGLLLRPHLQQSKHTSRLGVLDFVLLMLWWVYIYVYLVMCWQYVSPNEDLYNRNYDRLYMVETLVVLVVLGILLKRSAGTWRGFYALILGAVLFNSICFVLENRAIELTTYFNGSWYDTSYLASLSLFMVVAIRGRVLRQTPDTTLRETYRSWLGSLAILAVLSLPLIVLAAVLDGGVSPEVVRFRVLVTALAMFAMAGLVFKKQQLLHEELKRTNCVLEESSMTDPLTGIRNRRFFSATIQGEIAESVRAYAEGSDRATRDLIFYLIDLDNFKQVNDLHGHDAGDRVLIEASQRIRSAIRGSDELVRWGGEEFLVVSRHTDRREARVLAERVIEAVRGGPFAVGPVDNVHQTCSIGWAAFPWSEEDVRATGHEAVLKYADQGLYRAKQSGKDQAIGMTPLGVAEFYTDLLPTSDVQLSRGMP